LGDPVIRELALLALDSAKSAGAQFADVRFSRNRSPSRLTRERRVQGLSENDTFGFGVRTLVSGAWGFAASSDKTLTSPSSLYALRNSFVSTTPINLSSDPSHSGKCECNRAFSTLRFSSIVFLKSSALTFTPVLVALTFGEPDLATFRCLALALEAGRTGGTMPAAMNAANEIAVAAFLAGSCRLTDVDRVVETVMEAHDAAPLASVEQVEAVDSWARGRAREALAGTG
jgi:hypothetical protein